MWLTKTRLRMGRLERELFTLKSDELDNRILVNTWGHNLAIDSSEAIGKLSDRLNKLESVVKRVEKLEKLNHVKMPCLQCDEARVFQIIEKDGCQATFHECTECGNVQ